MRGSQRTSRGIVTGGLLMLLSFVLASSHAAAAVPSSNAFRCLRPFSAMDSFATVAKEDASQNCNFHYFTVTAASAELSCVTTADGIPSASLDARDGFKNDEAGASASCNVTVRWTMQRAGNVVEMLQRQVGTDEDYFMRQTAESTASSATSSHPRTSPSQPDGAAAVAPFFTEDSDIWRYAISLRAKGDSTVQYKGFNNGGGYSMCCDCIAEGECAWLAAEQGDNDLAVDEEVNPSFSLHQHRMLWGCPLPFPEGPSTKGDEDGGFGAFPGARVTLTDLDEDLEAGKEKDCFRGQITKPLHRLVEGPWEVTVQMWRRRQLQSSSSTTPASVPMDSNIEAEVLGRVVVPFTLDFTQLEKEGRVTHVKSMALTVEDVTEVVPAPAPLTRDKAGDDKDDL
ncbi:hypothetical protein ABL78_6839 [Leptomonas seymouri]|uniref:Uncharacterized protein n=1 Tax=Leptomonas seymouri TaxID=5684 RepID=A0A0N1I1F8_LEPSE|nr:hypothetical protein ABL78_6839 [Leptomonas seymouri]|eukprot:KPI84102.1 hypothetical protein ABL78_6839 [Leptomonas seymouri]